MLVKHVGGSVGQGMRAEFVPTEETLGESDFFPVYAVPIAFAGMA